MLGFCGLYPRISSLDCEYPVGVLRRDMILNSFTALGMCFSFNRNVVKIVLVWKMPMRNPNPNLDPAWQAWFLHEDVWKSLRKRRTWRKNKKDRKESAWIVNNINMTVCKSNTHQKTKDISMVNNCWAQQLLGCNLEFWKEVIVYYITNPCKETMKKWLAWANHERSWGSFTSANPKWLDLDIISRNWNITYVIRSCKFQQSFQFFFVCRKSFADIALLPCSFLFRSMP